MALRQHFAQQRQHGRVREMKQDGTDQEDHETSILQEGPQLPRLSFVDFILRSPGPLLIDFLRSNEPKGKERRDGKGHDKEKDPSIRKIIAD